MQGVPAAARLVVIVPYGVPRMARKARLHVAGGLYHVTLRGNHRQRIFFQDPDRVALESFVADAVVRHGSRVHAYCWMTNHIHLLVQVGAEPLGRIMQSIASRYARLAQRRAGTTGHLFERRYHALLVDTESYLLALVRYIHLNPVRGGLVGDPSAYPWSSHRCYLGLESRPWLVTECALGMLAPEPRRAINAYRNFVAQALAQPPVSPIAGVDRCDVRVLGDEAFIRRLPKAVDARPTRISLDDLITQVCREFAASPADLASASRSRTLNRVRAEILRRALDGRVATCSEVARRFGRSAAALCQLANRARQKAAEASVAPAAPCIVADDAGPETLKR